MKTVVGVYRNAEDANKSVKALRKAGFPREHISLIHRHFGGQSYHTDWATALGTMGAFLGGVAGLLFGLGLLQVAGLEPLRTAGTVISTLAGIGAGALAGGVLGALINLAIPGKRAGQAEVDDDTIFTVGPVIAVRTADTHIDEAREALTKYDPLLVDEYEQDWYENQGFIIEKSPAPSAEDATTVGAAAGILASSPAVVPVTGEVVKTEAEHDGNAETYDSSQGAPPSR